MRTKEQRINIIIGQLEAVKRMMAKDDNKCTDLIIQLKAIKSALSSLLQVVVSDEVERCLLGQEKEQQDLVLKMLKELVVK